ncbi:hypothetical protein TYRP_020202 [Tyrophagus putrescentiae]|nr:hypothetical protein TYRP_020202 [Tyrophagus putrescentiae]
MESMPRGGSTFTPPQKIPPPQPPPPPPSNSVKKELADFEQNRCQDISSEKCAPALQILIIFYRFFGFSFSGVLFINKPPPPPPPKDRPKFGSSSSSVEVWSSASSVKNFKENKTLEEPSKIESSPSSKSFFTPLRIVLLLYNLIIVTGYLFPVITDHLPIQTAKRLILGIHGANVPDDDDANNNSTLNNLRPLNFGEYFARTTDEESISVDRDSFSQLKPVMRTIIRSLVAVFFLEGAGSFLHSLLFGGRLLRRLAAISTQDLEARALQGKGPCSRRHAVLVIVILFCSIPLVMSAGFAAFDQQISEKSFSISSFFTASRMRKIAIHWWHFIALSTYSTLFVVSMLMVGRRLQEMTTKVEASKRKKSSFRSFGEPELAALYQRVEALQGHFRTTVACFSLPVTFTLAASTFTLIGSVCFLMISPDRSYASFIFSIGLFALLRLFVVNSCGNLATAAYGRLLRTVYEAMGEGGGDNWSVDAWLLFGELRRLKADFKVAFFAGTFTVKQSSILTLVGFSIQYIVILLQTENYDGGGGSAAGSSVSEHNFFFITQQTAANMKTTILKHIFSATSETIEDPPASLQLLVRFYRFFSLSFTGVLFTTTSKSASSNSNSNSTSNHHLPLRLLLISANLAAFTFYILPLLSFLLFGDPWAVHASLKNNSEYTLGKEIFDPTFATLKPVLKTLITSMAWLMMAESTFTCGHNLLAGGGLVRQLADLSKGGVRKKKFDTDTRWAVCSLTKVGLAIVAFISLGLTTFARAYLVAIFESIKKGGKVEEYHNENPYLLLGGLALKLLKHTYHYFTYSLYPLLFAYLMTTVKQSIEAIKEEVFEDEDEDGEEVQQTSAERLQQIKARLQTLQGHLQEVINSLALPLTFSMVVTTLLLTGTVCFLIVNSGGDGGNQNAQHFGLFFCNVAAFHLLRLVALCAAGSQAEAAHEDLLLTLYGRINSNSKKRSFGGGWDVDAWLAFQELKRLDFRVTLFGGLYRLRQSTILAVLAFVSNHIVVLLQTENYGR